MASMASEAWHENNGGMSKAIEIYQWHQWRK
jgi:hypothetical protein